MEWVELLAVLFFALGMAGGYPCCCGPKCDCCALADPSSSTPRSVIVTFSGVGNSNCADCDDFNVAFELRTDPTDSNRCSWIIDEGLPCGITKIEAEITCESPGTGLQLFFYRVQIFDGIASDGHFVFNDGVATMTPIDCTDPGVMDYLAATSENEVCDWSSATCTVSS
jgi:hypothetical protein